MGIAIIVLTAIDIAKQTEALGIATDAIFIAAAAIQVFTIAVAWVSIAIAGTGEYSPFPPSWLYLALLLSKLELLRQQHQPGC